MAIEGQPDNLVTGRFPISVETSGVEPLAEYLEAAVALGYRPLPSQRVTLADTYTSETTDRDGLAARSTAAGFRTTADDTWSDIFSRILVARVEPMLGNPQPTILHGYPVHVAALARRVPNRPQHAERFELYVCGVELANGFGELTDPVEQRRRLEAEMAEKSRIYGDRYPIDEEFLTALAHMPAASGCALGFDRLVLLATGATHIDQVLWTPMPGPT